MPAAARESIMGRILPLLAAGLPTPSLAAGGEAAAKKSSPSEFDRCHNVPYNVVNR